MVVKLDWCHRGNPDPPLIFFVPNAAALIIWPLKLSSLCLWNVQIYIYIANQSTRSAQ